MALANVKKRDENIDVLKGLAIICVVLGHCGFPGGAYIYLFHMAVFFMASGYCFDAKKIQSSDNLWEYALKKLRSLWLPYVIFNTLGWIFYNTFIQIGFLTENPEFPDAVSRMEWPSIVNAIAWVFHMVYHCSFLYYDLVCRVVPGFGVVQKAGLPDDREGRKTEP